jgi:16S rRNA C967 or C1407 C5-methylase (RsmB/RsmF family)
MHKASSRFHEYFSTLYGVEVWQDLFLALQANDKKIARLNPFFDLESNYQKELLKWPIHELMGQKYLTEVDARHFLKITQLNESKIFYFLDLASLLPPLALDLRVGESCLDMCAAPGGKSLILASQLAPTADATLELTTNEISQDRRSRLIRVLREQLPDPVFRQIKITAHDASKWCLYQKSAFDKILLDVPCSGERYFVADHAEVEAWTKKRSQNLSRRQFAILASAFEVLKVSGLMVYSTCSISNFENDEVVRKLLKKREGRVQIEKFNSPIGTPTEFGWAILPIDSGWGPIYFSVIRRLSE